MKIYEIIYEIAVMRVDIPAIPGSVRKAITRAIEKRIAIDPISYGKPLRYSLKGHRRIRVADYRIVYRIDETAKKVYIIAIKHRKEVYEN